MTKKELLDKIVSPAIEVIKAEGLIVEIDNLYKDINEFTTDLDLYFNKKFVPIRINYSVNTENFKDYERELAYTLQELAETLSDIYFDRDDKKDKE